MKATLGGICALALIIASCMGEVASAKGGCKSNACKANIQQGNFSCGVNHPELPILGTVSFARRENKMTLSVVVKHAEDNATYEVVLLGRSGCTSLGTSFTFKTDKEGRGHGQGVLEVPARVTDFFADVFHPGCVSGHCHNETPSVLVGP